MKKLDISPPVTNACGILSYPDVFQRLEKNYAKPGAWVIKSIGPIEKQGNNNPTYIEGGMNSFALPCASHDSIEDELENIELQIPLIGSCYGSESKDYFKIIKRFDKYFIGWELNVSCPNFESGEESVMDTMCNTKKAIDLVQTVRKVTEKPIITKLSPNEDYVTITKAIAPYVDYIGCGNTLGPGLEIDYYTGHPILAGKFGGISGEAIRLVTQKMVYEVNQAVPNVGKVAAGGISKPEDIIRYSRLGADIFQLGTVFEKYKSIESKAKFINDTWSSVQTILEQMGVSSLEEIKGVNYV